MWSIEKFQKAHPGKDQDRMISGALIDGHFIAVFDRHGRSDDAAEICVSVFTQQLRAVSEKDTEKQLTAIFEQVAKKTAGCIGGSTATVACLFNSGKVVAAILGDSPILARIDDHDVIVGPNHNAWRNKQEREAAEKRGGVYDYPYICNSYGDGVQFSRSFENAHLRPVISTEPEFKSCIVKDGWVAVMSDGILDTLFDEYEEHEATFIKMVDSNHDVEHIVNVFYPQKRDDTSLIVARYKRGGEAVAGDPKPKLVSTEVDLDLVPEPA